MGKGGRQVFVDPTGRRRRLARMLATGVAVLVVCFLVLLGAGAVLGLG